MTQARNTMATTTGSVGEPDESALPPLGTRAGTGAGAAVGQSRIHESARAQVAGAARYIDDLPELRGTLYAALVLSPVAHGELIGEGIDQAVVQQRAVAFLHTLKFLDKIRPVLHVPSVNLG